MLYGELNVEADVKETQKCREIVKTIVDFGVNDREIFKIINIIRLELENRDALIKIGEVVKEFIESEDGNIPKIAT